MIPQFANLHRPINENLVYLTLQVPEIEEHCWLMGERLHRSVSYQEAVEDYIRKGFAQDVRDHFEMNKPTIMAFASQFKTISEFYRYLTTDRTHRLLRDGPYEA